MCKSKSKLQNSGGGLCDSVAVLSAVKYAQEDGWRQLMPAGYFRSSDGRPFEPALEKGWYLDETIANNLINYVAALKDDVVVDYEHQTINCAANGLPAPASGKFNENEIKWCEDGLFIRPRWTQKAKDYLDNGEYDGLSPVFHYDEITGHPVDILHVALTNDPGLKGMRKLTKLAALKYSSQPDKQENKMDELLISLLTALGITVENDDVESAVKSALDSISQLNTAKETAETAVATLKANSATTTAVDLREYVPIATYNALRENVATLKAENDGLSIDQLIDAGRKDGRVLISEVDYFKNLGAQAGVAVLKSTIDGRSPIAALTSTQTKATAAQPVAKLTADQQTAAALLGKTDDEFLAILKKEGI